MQGEWACAGWGFLNWLGDSSAIGAMFHEHMLAVQLWLGMVGVKGSTEAGSSRGSLVAPVLLLVVAVWWWWTERRPQHQNKGGNRPMDDCTQMLNSLEILRGTFTQRDLEMVRQKVLRAAEIAKSKTKTAAQDCADKTAAWDKEARKLQRLKSQRDESVAKLAKLDQEILGSVEQVAGPQRENLEALDALQN